MNSRYEKPFLQEQELNEKIARLNELNVELDLENGKMEDVDLNAQENIDDRVAEQGNYYMNKSPGKAGLAVLAVPLFYSLYGEMQNKQLIKEIEQTIVEDTGHEEEVQQDKGKTSSDKEEETLFEDGDVIGNIEIETLDLKYPIVEGAGSSEFSVGIGHIPDTAGIGDTGNCVLAGHRAAGMELILNI